MLNITDNAVEQKILPLFRLGFRPLFLSAGIFSVVVIGIWLLTLSGWLNFQPYGQSLWWHGHEMIFGFASAVIVGFLLTAVGNWTGQPGLKGKPLMLLWGTWLLARLMLLINVSVFPPIITTLIDLLFLPLAAFLLAKPILAVKQYRNLFFVPVLLLLALCNLITHLDVIYGANGHFRHGAYAAIMFITLIMTVMGGRVIPFFTANGTQTQRKDKIALFELTSLVCTWLLAFGFIFNLVSLPQLHWLFGVLFLLAAIANFARFSRWRFFATVKVPLLWSLQLAYLFIPVSFVLLSVHFLFDLFNLSSLLHGLTVGAMGNMILAMMARVSLGHTGRPLIVSNIIPSAFGALVLAALIRIIGATFASEYYVLSIYISGIFWIYGYAVFSIVYLPILTSPRTDGRPG